MRFATRLLAIVISWVRPDVFLPANLNCPCHVVQSVLVGSYVPLCSTGSMRSGMADHFFGHNLVYLAITFGKGDRHHLYTCSMLGRCTRTVMSYRIHDHDISQNLCRLECVCLDILIDRCGQMSNFEVVGKEHHVA